MDKSSTEKTQPVSQPTELKVLLELRDKSKTEYVFKKEFKIGRDINCELQIEAPGISRQHALIYFEKGFWWYKDLDSANGSFVAGRKVREFPINKTTRVELGLLDAFITFSVESKLISDSTIRQEIPSLTQYIRHYFQDDFKESIGDHTRLIRNAFKKVQKKQKMQFGVIILAVALIAIIIAIYSYKQHQEIIKQKELGKQIFYTMKSLELEIVKLQDRAIQEDDSSALAEIEKYRMRTEKLTEDYNRFLEELHFYDESQWNEQERIILHTARMFGECELGMPSDFIDEVQKYIREWKKTSRLQEAFERAVKENYPEFVAKTFLEQGLPPNFFYLGLQESDYNIRTIGPRTRFGIAKGIWQFIPATASRYGLKTGPLVGMRRFDPRDERFDFNKSTLAAAKYLRDIYKTEAQASGLLVIASYNWGERKVRELVRQMSENPKDRNFWQLLKLYRDQLPKQTYDYVFYIISAAAIGENPRLFGFDLENPLQDIFQ
jgi:membrane-bound lytic murein transglycosylase D